MTAPHRRAQANRTKGTHPDTHRIRRLAQDLRNDARALESLAEYHQAAQDHVDQELSLLGFPQRGDGARVSGGGGPARDCECGDRDRWCDACRPRSGVERDADVVYELSSIREDVRDQVRHMGEEYEDWRSQIRAAGLVVHAARRKGLSAEERQRMNLDKLKPSVCADNQHGKHGADEWGDAVCLLPSVKSGLCMAHYWAWYRKRKADGIDIGRDFEATA